MNSLNKKYEIEVEALLTEIGNEPINIFEKPKALSTYDALVYKVIAPKHLRSKWVRNPIIKRIPIEERAVKIFEQNNLFGTLR
ncbi:hypothetical protein K4L44_14075 [Halosquirtibacter laminarini]|uniref:Uncharacterized protein n=1 Tax=Halosquirtibacter laminarini TaxID=3374600 RepID=A0AC61NJW6_9BACT|nr:hypothetical protein K4L44_14075 [Prolixibacteraceae bacterium]